MSNLHFKSGLNYFSTIGLLLWDFVRFQGARSIWIIASVVVTGLFYPVPFALLGLVLHAMLSGRTEVSLSLQGWSYDMGVDAAFVVGLALAALAQVLLYAAKRLTLNATTAWQTALFWRAINRLPRLARWNRESLLPLPLQAKELPVLLLSIVRQAFLIGLIIGVGFQDAAIIFGALLVLLWLDPMSVAILLLIALVFVPIYGVALITLAGMRAQAAKQVGKRRHLLQLVVGAVSGSNRQAQPQRMAARDVESFAPHYGLINNLFHRMNYVNLLAGIQVCLSIAAIYIVNGAVLSSFVRDKLVFFIVLLFMMRSALSLMSVFSRLTRGYAKLALLRAFFYPLRKTALHDPQAPTDAAFAFSAPEASLHYVRAAEPVFVLIPRASSAFGLLALSNALRLLTKMGPAGARHIPLLSEEDVQQANNGGGRDEPPAEVTIGEQSQSIKLALSHPEPLDGVPVVAVTRSAWRQLEAQGKSGDFSAGRIVFIVIPALDEGADLPADAMLIVSDGSELLHAGPAPETFSAYAQDAFRRSEKGERKRLDDEEEEES